MLTRQNVNRMKLLLCCAFLIIITYIMLNSITAKATVLNAKTYTVKTSLAPMNTKYLKYSTYTKYTKQYYMLRSYLEQLEKDGGGTLILTAGTYKISNTLYIPSNVTINLEDGVIIKKIEETGVSGLISSNSIFQMAAPSKSSVKGAYGGYNGVSNVKIIGNGTAIIDLNFDADCLGIMMCHNTNVTISGIIFQNMNSGHFIELDASKNVNIENNSFIHHKASPSGIKEAINIDTPDKSTNGFHATWTNYDCTPDKNILIQNNYFDDLERAIGTHKYSEGKYHQNIQILNNKISNIDSDAIRILNWDSPIIKGNVIKTVAGGSGNKRAILVSGVKNPTITENTFSKVSRPIQIMPWKNSGDGSQYAITYNDVSLDNITLMLKNTLTNVGERILRINYSYNNFTSNTSKYYYDSHQDD